jgi:hypothetical protein
MFPAWCHLAVFLLSALLAGGQADSAAPPGPAAVAAEFYALHFAHDMAFTPLEVKRRSAFLSPGLLALCADYFAAPQAPDEVPAVDGDPFTDSQDYPESYEVGEANQQGDAARVVVKFAMKAGDRWRVQVDLVKTGAGWKIDDIEPAEGPSLRSLLRETGTRSSLELPAAVAGYRRWTALSKDPIAVPLSRWLLCRQPFPSETAAARAAHGEHANRYVRIFVNGLAASHSRAGGPLPEGAVVVKEKLEQPGDVQPVAVAAMVKRAAGAAPELGDWEFLYVDRETAGTPAASPALQAHCGGCHASRRAADFLVQSD